MKICIDVLIDDRYQPCIVFVFKTKSSKRVHPLMRDRRMNAYGVRLKRHCNSLVLTDTKKSIQFTQTFVTISSHSFEIALENVFSKIERRVLVPNLIMSL